MEGNQDKQERRIHRLTFDSVTKLLKKEGFIDKVSEEDQDILDVLNGPYALGVLDLDKFKLVNDRFGHAFGDRYLREIAAITDELTWGENDDIGNDDIGFVFRGKEGDEFIFVLKINGSEEKLYRDRIAKFKEKLNEKLKILSQKFSEEGYEIDAPSVSIGTLFKPEGLAQIFSPNDKLSSFFTDVDKKVDRALYKAKKQQETTLGKDNSDLVNVVLAEDLENE